MLTCVCRPVTSSLPKPPTMAPQKRSPIVVTCEPRFATATIVKKPKTSKKVPGRPTAAELRAMALRQQQQIDSQHQLLAAKEQRLRFLKAQEARGAAAAAEGERLRRLRERVEAQESKLRRLRALRGQVDLQKTYNVTLSNDLDSIRALFSEKEKELSLAVAKVEALTRQLEDLRRDRRGPLNLIPGGAPNGNQQQSAAARELDKLRRELMYRNQLSLQQDARLHLQREALQQRQAELRSVDQRILELQSRLQRKKASNLLLHAAQHPSPSPPQLTPPAATQPLHNGTTTATVRPSNNVYPSQRVAPRANNVAAVEPYVHTPQKNNSAPITKPSQHLIHDLATLKQLNQASSQASIVNHVAYAESDESKLARQKRQLAAKIKEAEEDLTVADFAAKKNDPKYQTLPYNTKFGAAFNSKTPSSSSIVSTASSTSTTTVTTNAGLTKTNECDSEKASEMVKKQGSSASLLSKTSAKEEKPTPKPKSLHQIPSGNLVVPPRKPISSVAPTTMIPKIVAHNPKVQMVAPTQQSGIPVPTSEADKIRPALPPKPNKSPPQSDTDTPNSSSAVSGVTTSAPTIVSVINKPQVADPTSSSSDSSSPVLPPPMGLSDNLPIKAKPLTIKKQPIHEQPKLRSSSGIKPVQYTSRRIEMPPAFLFPEVATAELKDKSEPPQSSPPVAPPKIDESTAVNGCLDETDKSTSSSNTDDTVTSSESEQVQRRTRTASEGNGKAKLTRRVSFDPLALLLDASLEGELELVRKTAMQVTNPSAANDEGITALHNAICAGHLEIVKFLVEYGCDVNAQDSDGWTPLHCAASCNNLAMVKFLVESGACLFAATLSDHETPAEKCEEDEEGFDGCSEYLYSIQEKLGILNSGEVYAVFSYDAQQTDELSFTINDRLTILRKGDDAEREWWWAKDSTGKEGYVPRNLLGLYPRISTRHSPSLE
ncbi:apoptosis-stimulating of p53 protein 1 [Sergentomyia squamirostris]